MVCIVFLLLLVPGMVTWEIAKERELADWRDVCGAVVSWLVHDLVIACLVYAAFYLMKGAVTISFSAKYLEEEVYYSVYDISFVCRYSALALVMAVGLGVLERLAGKCFHERHIRAGNSRDGESGGV